VDIAAADGRTISRRPEARLSQWGLIVLELHIPEGVEWVKRREAAAWALARMDDVSEFRLSVFMPSGFDG
jgi:hypothetical protein